MDEHDKRAREVARAWLDAGGVASELPAAIATALRSTAAAAVAAERERAEARGRAAGIGECLEIALRYDSPGYAQAIREEIEALSRANVLHATPAPVASSAQAERVSEEDLREALAQAQHDLALTRRCLDCATNEIDHGTAALLTERHRIAARLRARADAWRAKAVQHGREGSNAWEGECYRAMHALRAEADALEEGT